MASDNLSVDPMAMFANMNDDPFQTDINNSEEVPDNSEGMTMIVDDWCSA